METCGFPINKVKIPQIPSFLQATILHTLKILFSRSIFEVFRKILKGKMAMKKKVRVNDFFLDGNRL